MCIAHCILGDGLTGNDIRLIEQIAERMIEAGAWERVVYCRSENTDIVEAYQADLSEPVYGIGRRFGGLYVVDDYRSGRVTLGPALILTLNQHTHIDPDYAPNLPN